MLGTEEIAFLAANSVAGEILILKRLSLMALTEFFIGPSTVTAMETAVRPTNPTQKKRRIKPPLFI